MSFQSVSVLLEVEVRLRHKAVLELCIANFPILILVQPIYQQLNVFSRGVQPILNHQIFELEQLVSNETLTYISESNVSREALITSPKRQLDIEVESFLQLLAHLLHRGFSPCHLGPHGSVMSERFFAKGRVGA